MKLISGTFLVSSLSVGYATASWAQLQSHELDRRLSFDPEVTVDSLDNGLHYYIRVNSRPEKRAELRLVLNAGSVLEDEDQRGLAHFVEHMAFNGTEGFPRQELVDYLERAGMRFGPDLNAYTSFDETVYRLQVPTDSAELLPTAFQILEEWAHRLTFDPDMVDGERGVVIEEWRMGRGADARMLDQQFPILFQGSQYARRLPVGDKEAIQSFDLEALERYYRDWYRPDLMAVIAVGDFDRAAVERMIREHFSALSTPKVPRPRPEYQVPDHDETRIAIAADKEATQSQISIYYKQPLRKIRSAGAYRRMIVERLYNRMLNDRLFELTQQPDPPFLYGSSGQGRLIRSKEVYVLGAAVRDGGVTRGLEALLTEAERVARYGFTATELERHKVELWRIMERSYAERDKTNSSEYAYEYANAFLTGDPVPGVEAEYEMHLRFLPGIMLQEVNQLAREWLVDRNRVILVSAPKNEVPLPSEGALMAAFDVVKGSEIAPYVDEVEDSPLVAEPPAPGQIVGEHRDDPLGVTVWELSNGARVILKPTDFKDDEVLFRASSPGGTSLAPDRDYIAASTAADVVSVGGLGTFSLVELQKKLAGKVASVSPSIGPLYESMAGSASPDDLETLFELIYLTFTSPRRDSTAYLAYRTQMEAILSNRRVSPADAFQDTLTVTLTQHHFRTRPPTSDVYKEMDLEKSLEFYRDRFSDAGDFTFVFVGSFAVPRLRPLVEHYIASLPSNGRVETWRNIGITPPKGVVERVVRNGMEPKSQTHIVFTGPLEFNRENAYLLCALAEVLQIRLRERLREELGGTYSVTVGGVSERDPVPSYSMRISFGADPERLDELAAVVFQEIDSLKIRGATATDVEKVRESERRTLETKLKENNYWLWQLLTADRLDMDPYGVVDNSDLIDALTPETVQEAARKYLLSDNYVRVSLYPAEDYWE
jgi:zinc protease